MKFNRPYKYGFSVSIICENPQLSLCAKRSVHRTAGGKTAGICRSFGESFDPLLAVDLDHDWQFFSHGLEQDDIIYDMISTHDLVWIDTEHIRLWYSWRGDSWHNQEEVQGRGRRRRWGQWWSNGLIHAAANGKFAWQINFETSFVLLKKTGFYVWICIAWYHAIMTFYKTDLMDLIRAYVQNKTLLVILSHCFCLVSHSTIISAGVLLIT